jgi:AraC family cel operon transcriptional repressor
MIKVRNKPRRLRLRWFVAPGEAFHVARSQHSRRSVAPYHSHDFTELFWVNGGEGWHDLNGRRSRLEAGDLWFIRADDAHSLEAAGGAALSITNIAFPTETADFIRERYLAHERRWFWGDRPEAAAVRVDAARLHALNSAADRLALAPRERLHVEHFLLTVFTELTATPADEKLSAAPDWLAAACRNLHRPERLREGVPGLVRLAGRCPEHVARVMRRTLGTTPSDYVNGVRMGHAAFQLRLTARSVTEIALDTGYENLSHFFHVFRRAHGMTPRTYRRKLAASP